MNEKYKKYTQRLEELIKEFDEDIFSQRKYYPNYYGERKYKYEEEIYNKIQSWLMKCENILAIIFGLESVQVKRFLKLRDNLEKTSLYEHLCMIKGLIEADLYDLNKGFIFGQEFIIANEIFDWVLEEARFFIYEQKNKDIGAMLLRIVLEDAIKRIAKKEEIEIRDKKMSFLNEELKAKGIFIQTVWRQNQAWLDIGNNASHGNFEEYNLNQVENFYQGIINFLSTYFNN